MACIVLGFAKGGGVVPVAGLAIPPWLD